MNLSTTLALLLLDAAPALVSAKSLREQTYQSGREQTSSSFQEQKRALDLNLNQADDVTYLTLGQDVNYPPFAFQQDGELTGVGLDIANGMSNLCPNLEINVVEIDWELCWSSENGGQLGQAVANGTLDGCMTYTHTRSRRDELAEFSDAILLEPNPAGLLTLLDEDGLPNVDGMDDLDGRTIIDVGGWAPTADTFRYITNQCTLEEYSKNVDLVVATGTAEYPNPNDAALDMLLRGEGDAIYIYASQATLYGDCDDNSDWNCTLWEGFGSEFAYVQSGQLGYTINGTTLSLSRPGSGIREILRPCLQEFIQTKEYYEICKKYNVTNQCFQNQFFSDDSMPPFPYQLETDEQTGDCSDGFCSCDVMSSDSVDNSTPTSPPTSSGEWASLSVFYWFYSVASVGFALIFG